MILDPYACLIALDIESVTAILLMYSCTVMPGILGVWRLIGCAFSSLAEARQSHWQFSNDGSGSAAISSSVLFLS